MKFISLVLSASVVAARFWLRDTPAPSSDPIDPNDSEAQSPEPSQVYVTGFPICNVSGFTEVPGRYIETIFKDGGMTLPDCADACRTNDTCMSIAFAQLYGECLFFDHSTEDVQLLEDDTSIFAHYDNECDIDCDPEDEGTK
ncbi:hypothetical protein EJ06DRAFT_559157 [Trichodelitschia bisporula]|uniref:Apple domain-containing protein n=1 Tax=Trichodelitschia bisporula TaxID=703511 RepID=A0A6G1HNH1_9PEZI|nr:hypothetical protein EJ06DRAFT_559157 [Trichodelitschia bisporula]